jgi:putative ABC transport system permease protein
MDPAILDSIAGDLEEERRRRAGTSSTSARLWLWKTWIGIRLYVVGQAIENALRNSRPPRFRGEWRAAIRSLRSAPAYTIACVSVIALSMSLATTVFAVVDGVLFKPMPYERPNELIVIRPGHADRAGNEGAMAASPNDLSVWRAALPDILIAGTRMPAGVPSQAMPTGPDVNALRVQTADVDEDFLRVLGVHPVLGGFPNAAFRATSRDVPRSALLTYGLWQTAFGGDPQIVGRVVTITDQPRVAFEIDGVLPPSFVCPSRVDAQMLLAAVPLVQPGGALRRQYSQVVARVPAGESVAIVRQRLEAAMAAAPPTTIPGSQNFAGTPFARQFAPFDAATIVPLRDFINGWQARTALAVFAAALVLLMLGGVNVSGLVVARGQQRSRAVAMRRALGADGFAIVGFILAEVGVLVVAGTALGFSLAPPLLRIVVGVLPATFHPLKPIVIDWRVAAFAAGVGALGALLVTIAPARKALGRTVVLQGETSAVTRRLTTTSRLNIALQVALAMTLAVGGSLLVGSLINLWREPLGFDHQATAISLRLRRAPQAGGGEDISAVLDRVRRVPGVEAAGVMDAMLLQNAMTGGGVDPPAGRPKNDIVDVPVSPGLLDVTRPTMLEGRFPTTAELAAGSALVVSLSTAREFWPHEPAVGQTLTANGATLTVVGVAEDARFMSWDLSQGIVYEPYSKFAKSRTPNLLVRGRNGATPPVGDVLAAIASAGPWVQAARVEPLDGLLAESVRDRRFNAWLFGAFASAALAIMLTGLFGLVAMTAAQRTREVGIRIALGATRERVVALLVGETAGAVVAGILVGGIVAAWAARYLKSSMYEMGVYDVRLWLVAAAALLVAAGIGAYLPAARASRIDPVRALRVD